MEHFDPKLVFMQFQMSSMRSMDINPIQLFHTYPGRVISLHVQGVNMNPPPAYVSPAAAAAAAARLRPRRQEAVRAARVVAVVAAALPQAATTSMGSIFEAGKVGGLQNYFVEQSWPLTQLSVVYLKALQV